ncbi:MAG: iron-containing alcohol dehydrogenase, partial [Firmicutes bacterium]|nr:iron-containing alcohol dehydrogenase [Bacillota bacterium]
MVQELSRDVGIPQGLSALGLPKEVIPELSKNAINDACFITNPRDVDVDGIMNIFYQAL